MKVLNNDININKFFEKVSSGSLLMLDYDGTLAPLVKGRMKAYSYSGVKDGLAALMGLTKNRTVIVSGRSLSDLETLLDMPGLELWGSHGLERKIPNGKKTQAQVDEKLRE